MQIRTGLQQHFFAWGFLIPAYLPIAEVIGRAVVDIILVLFLGWALIACQGRPIVGKRIWLWLYLLLLIALSASIPEALDVPRSLRALLRFSLQSLTLVITILALQQHRHNIDRLAHAFALAGTILLGYLYLLLPFQADQPGFIPAQILREDNIPLYLPFMLYALSRLQSSVLRRSLFACTLAFAFAYILLSEGRAALLAALVAVAFYLLLVGRWRIGRILVIGLPLLVITALATGSWIMRGAEEAGTFQESLDRFTSGRTQLWRQALEHPPANSLTGIGIGNLKIFANHSTVLDLPNGEKVRHLHNLLFDLWYEAGILGLFALLLLFGHILGLAAKGLREGLSPDPRISGVALASTLAILVASMLSFSYASRPVSLYLFVIAAMLIHLSSQLKPTHP